MNKDYTINKLKTGKVYKNDWIGDLPKEIFVFLGESTKREIRDYVERECENINYIPHFGKRLGKKFYKIFIGGQIRHIWLTDMESVVTFREVN